MASNQDRLTPKQVLLVEDDPYSEMVITRVLKRLDPWIEITWIRTAEEAHFSLGRKAFDLIIADIFLDGTATGLDFWQYCETDAPDIPFVITSGLPLEAFFKAVGRSAISPPYLLKPLNINECTQIIEGLLYDSRDFRKAG